MFSNGWERVTLSEIIARLDSGVSVKAEDRPARADEIGVLKVSAVAGGHFFPSENKAVPKAEHAKLAVSVRRGEIIVSRANTFGLIGASGIADADHPNLYLPDKLWRVVLNDPTRDCPRWLIHLLNAPDMRAALRARASGTSGSMKNISKESFLGISVKRPPKAEQAAIGRLLDQWVDAVERLRLLIRLKRRMKRGLMRQLITERIRFPEFTTSIPSTKSPADWTFVPLSEIATRVARKNSADVKHVLTISGRRGFVDQRDYFDRRIAAEDVAGYYRLRRGEFAYNRSLMKGYPFGAIKRLDEFDQGVVSTLYICFKLNDALVESDFMLHLFESGCLNSQLARIANLGSRAHGLLNVTAADFMTVKVHLPSRVEQRKIAALLTCCDREIVLLEQQLAAARQQRKGLMQELLTGRVRLRVPGKETNHD